MRTIVKSVYSWTPSGEFDKKKHVNATFFLQMCENLHILGGIEGELNGLPYLEQFVERM